MFISSEENELLLQCRVQCKRKNKYLEHICLDVIICMWSHIFTIWLCLFQHARLQTSYLTYWQSGFLAAVYIQACHAWSKQDLHGRWLWRVWVLHFPLGQGEKQGTVAKPGVSQSFITLDVCPNSPAAEIWSPSWNASLCLTNKKSSLVVLEKMKNINLN